jgi:hypothetical protein
MCEGADLTSMDSSSRTDIREDEDTELSALTIGISLRSLFSTY